MKTTKEIQALIKSCEAGNVAAAQEAATMLLEYIEDRRRARRLHHRVSLMLLTLVDDLNASQP